MKVGPKIPAREFLAASLVIGIATAQDRGQEPEPHKLTEIKTNGQPQLVSFSRDGKSGTYWIRVPAKARKDVATRAVLWMHGARGSGFEHQQALAAAGLGKSEILICPNGANRNGPYSYDHGRDAAPLVAALDDVAAQWKLGPVFVGGHSAGAFATHGVLAAAPDRFAGVLVCCGGAAGLLTPKALLEKGGAATPPIFLVHGEADPIVDGSSDDRLYEALLEAGWPAVRYLHPADLDHDLAKIPLKDCFEWLFALGSDKPQELLATAKQWAAGDRPRDALQALARAEVFKAPAATVQALRKVVLTRAAVLGKEWAKRFETEKGRDDAIAKFYDARSGLFGIDEAKPAFDAFARLAEAQAKPAADALREAQASGSADAVRAVVARFPAAYATVRAAITWLHKSPKK